MLPGPLVRNCGSQTHSKIPILKKLNTYKAFSTFWLDSSLISDTQLTRPTCTPTNFWMAFTVSHSAGKQSNDYATITHYSNWISPEYKSSSKSHTFSANLPSKNSIRCLWNRDIINCTIKDFTNQNLGPIALEWSNINLEPSCFNGRKARQQVSSSSSDSTTLHGVWSSAPDHFRLFYLWS